MALTHPEPVPTTESAPPAPAPGPVIELAGTGLRWCAAEQSIDLHPRWLRDRSTEPGQIDPSSRQRLFTPGDIDPDVAVVSFERGPDLLLVTFSDGHVARLSIPALEQAIGWEPDPAAPPGAEAWRGEPPFLPAFDWADIGWSPEGGDDRAVVSALDAFFRFGFVLLRDVPVVDGAVTRVAGRLGHLVPTNFGPLFDVRVEVDPTDLAFTAIELLAHTDLPYRRPPPGLQLLHCLANEAPGGDSTLVDGLAAWRAIASAAPELGRALADIEVDYRYDIGRDVVVNRGRVFQLDRAGRFEHIRFNTKLDTPSGGPDLDLWYQGRRWLTEWLNDPANRLCLRLEPGDVLCFDNHRILHGRTAFDAGAGRRHLQGCYIEHDGPDTLLRLARRRLRGAG